MSAPVLFCARPVNVAGQYLMECDARVKVAVALCLGLLIWRTGAVGLGAYGCLLCFAFWAVGGFPAVGKGFVRAYSFFILFWGGLKLGFDLWGGFGIERAFLESSLIGGRLFVLLVLGLCLALSTSPRGLGLALSWYLRPVFGRKAWQVALSFSLMVHFLPQAWAVLDQIRATLSRRCPGMPWYRRAQTIPLAALRVLGQKTWNQAVAIAARGLDRPEAWAANFDSRPADLFAGIVAVLAAVGLSRISL